MLRAAACQSLEPVERRVGVVGVREPQPDAADGRLARIASRWTTGYYALLAEVHAMLNFDDWFDRVDATDEQRDAAAASLRERVESEIARF